MLNISDFVNLLNESHPHCSNSYSLAKAQRKALISFNFPLRSLRLGESIITIRTQPLFLEMGGSQSSKHM